jgi:hypothetical protein
MWTALLAPVDGEGDGDVGTFGDGDARRNTRTSRDGVVAGAVPSARNVSQHHDRTGLVSGVRYCHKFARFGTCPAARCPFPHLSAREARSKAASERAGEAKGAYANLVGASLGYGDAAGIARKPPSAWAL